jgi:hypothetical protein
VEILVKNNHLLGKLSVRQLFDGNITNIPFSEEK